MNLVNGFRRRRGREEVVPLLLPGRRRPAVLVRGLSAVGVAEVVALRKTAQVQELLKDRADVGAVLGRGLHVSNGSVQAGGPRVRGGFVDL